MKQENLIGRILFWTGIAVLVVGLYPAIKNALMTEYDPFGDETGVTLYFEFFLQIYMDTFLKGIILIGLSELINQLSILIGKQQVQAAGAVADVLSGSKQAAEVPPDLNRKKSVGKQEKEMIHDLYKDHAILEIHPTHLADYFVVRLQDYQGPPQSYLKVVETNGFHAEEVKDTQLAEEIIAAYEKDANN